MFMHSPLATALVPNVAGHSPAAILAANAFLSNPLMLVDSYKFSHLRQYPPGTEYVYAYVEARGSSIDGINEVMLFGLQAFLKSYLSVPITAEHVAQAADFAAKHGIPFEREAFDYVVKYHKGYWPVTISAMPEGQPVPVGTPLVTIVNTDPKCHWVPSFLETPLLRACWYGSTVATISRACKEVLASAMELSCDDPTVKLPFMLHDFGARGASSFESASIGAAAHMVNFSGTDTMSGIAFADAYYDSGVCGYSIPASEHSTMTSWGRSFEEEAYANMIEQFGKPGAMFSVVSDSYDLDEALRRLWGGSLKDKVIASGATLVIRPDSGDPATVVCETIETLMECYGFTTNTKGYRLLPSCVRVIQGDGITVHTLPGIVEALLANGLSLDNVCFGMGGGLLQNCTRDTFRFAMKTSAAFVDGYWRDVFKDPVGDSHKRSKAGRVTTVVTPQGQYLSRDANDFREGEVWAMRLVWATSTLLVDDTFGMLRSRAAIPVGNCLA